MSNHDQCLRDLHFQRMSPKSMAIPMKAAEPRIQVIYSAIHPRCGHRMACTHPRISSRVDLKSFYAHMVMKGKLQTINLYCHHCAQSFEPTHIEIIEDAKIIVRETEIEKFIATGGKVTPSKS